MQPKTRRRRRPTVNLVAQLETSLADQLRLCAETEQQQHVWQEREKVMCDLIMHQAFLGELLQKGLADQAVAVATSLEAAHQQPNTQSQQPPVSYVASLLRTATQQQVQEVLAMSVSDWLHYFSDAFPKLTIVLELCGRFSYITAEDAASDSYTATLAAGIPTPAAPGSDNGREAVSAACPNEAAMGMCAAADYQRLQELIDAIAQRVMLGYLYHHVPLLEACACRYDGPQGRPPPGHWERAADRLGLTEVQQLHMSICLEEYKRVNQGSRADGGALVERAATPGLLVAAAQQEKHQQQLVLQPPGTPSNHVVGQAGADANTPAAAHFTQGGGRSSCTENDIKCSRGGPSPSQQQQEVQGSNDDEALLQELSGGEHEHLQQQLQQYVQLRHLHLLSAATFFMNTFSQYQLTALICASYPFLPSFTGIAEVVTKHVKQRQQEGVDRQAAAAVLSQGIREGRPSPDAEQAATAPGRTAAGGQQHVNGSVNTGPSSGHVSDRHTRASKSFLQALLDEHQQARAAQLELHRQLCWSQMLTSL